MKRPFLLFTSLLSLSLGGASAQTVKPAFNEFVYIDYHTVVSAGITHSVINDYIRINADGVNKSIQSLYIGDVYYGKGSDTTYKLNDTIIEAFNKVLDGKALLSSHLVTNKLPPGTHYAGQYECIIVSDRFGKTDHLLFVLSGLDEQLQKLVNGTIYRLPYGHFKSRPPYHNALLEDKLTNWYTICNCMPKIEQPPPMMSMPPPAGK